MLEFIKEDNKYGKLSFSRLVGTILIVLYSIWASFIVVTEKRIPDVPFNLFLLISSLYGLNVLKHIFQRWKKKE